jgi:HTH-type transcriptional regulator, glycine betaine synthesis regulator
MPEPFTTSTEVLPEWRTAMIDLFVNGALLIGLPKSVGQIYGYLYSAVEPASMDKIIADLAISKGSASQGLKFLRQLGAVKAQFVVGDRRDHFVAEVKSKKLMGGFIREKLTPALEDGVERIAFIRELLTEDGLIDDQRHADQITKLETWQKKLKLALPVIQKLMGE